jgi:hypothetical protein
MDISGDLADNNYLLNMYDDFHIVNSSQFTYILIGVFKELINKNNELHNEIISIKNDINKLFQILDK